MSDVIVDQSGPVLEVLFNRPEKKNALTRAMYDAVVEAFNRADEDPAIRVVLLGGAGDTFTSGNDIKDFQVRAATNEPTHASSFLTALSLAGNTVGGRRERSGDWRRHNHWRLPAPDPGW